MATCIGCGLTINPTTGLLEVKRDPAGGITCSDAGLSAAGVSGSAAAAQTTANAAMVAANEADDTADAAQASANTALDRAPGKMRWGWTTGTTNGAGDWAFSHGLGVIPTTVLLQPHASSATHLWECIVENRSNTTINVRIHNTTTGAAMASQAVGFSWFVAE